MPIQDLLKQFKTASWVASEELDAVAAEAGVVPPAEIVKLLEVLCSRGGSSPQQHRNRCVLFAKLVEQAPSEQLFVPFIRALKTVQDNQVRSLLANLLPKVNNIGAHAELCALLKVDDAEIRRVAAQVLRSVVGTTGFQILSEMARDPKLPGRLDVLDVLVAKGGYAAIPVLANVLENGKLPDKLQALRFLGDAQAMAKNTAGALRAIAGTLNDGDPHIVVQAIAAFGNLCTEDDYFNHISQALESTDLNMARAAVDGLRRFDSPRAIAALDKRFRVGPMLIRIAVLEAAQHIGSDSVLPILVQALGNRQIHVRQKAAEVLMALSVAKRIDLARTVLWLLRNRDVNVRRMAVELVKKVGDPSGELAPKMLRFLSDEDWWVRERITDALVEMAGTQLTRYVVAYLQDPSPVVRRYAVDFLGRLKDVNALGALVRTAAADVDWWVRERSLEIIGAMQDARAVPYLVEILGRDADTRIPCMQALAELGARDRLPQVMALIADPEPDVRVAVIECAKVLDDGRNAAQIVAGLLQDPEHRVRRAAREALQHWRYSVQDNQLVRGDEVSALDDMLLRLAREEGDDLLLAPGRPAYMKRLNKTVPLGTEPLSDEQLQAILYPYLSTSQREELEALHDVDFSHEIKAEGLRFRANIFRQVGGVAAVFRIIKGRLPDIETLGLPPIVKTFGDLKNGLVLVGGPTGSGKSTTLAGIIDYINRTSSRHIITIEDPVEVVHVRKKCLVNQREVGTHTRSFANALRATLREDPDVILVGEMRDLATISFAITAAETGHLVFGTVHTVSADTTMDRLINAFAPAQQPQVRAMLANSLRAVICQHLLRRKDVAARMLCVEVLLNTDAVANLIRKGKTFQIPSVIATSRDQGMQSMDSELIRLVKEGKIGADEAFMKANDKKTFETAVGTTDVSIKQDAPRPATAAPAAPAKDGVPRPAPAGAGGPTTRTPAPAMAAAREGAAHPPAAARPAMRPPGAQK